MKNRETILDKDEANSLSGGYTPFSSINWKCDIESWGCQLALSWTELYPLPHNNLPLHVPDRYFFLNEFQNWIFCFEIGRVSLQIILCTMYLPSSAQNNFSRGVQTQKRLPPQSECSFYLSCKFSMASLLFLLNNSTKHSVSHGSFSWTFYKSDANFSKLSKCLMHRSRC